MTGTHLSEFFGHGEPGELDALPGSVTDHLCGDAATARAATGMCRVDFEKDGWHVDDVAISGDLIEMFRLEQMDAKNFWGCVYMRDGRTLRFWMGSAKKLGVTAEWEQA